MRGRPVHAVRLKDVHDIAACPLVSFSPTPDDDGQGVTITGSLRDLRGKPVLTVSPAADFLAQGGLVQLYRVDSRRLPSVTRCAWNRLNLAHAVPWDCP